MYGFGNENSIEPLGQQVLELDENQVVDWRRVSETTIIESRGD